MSLLKVENISKSFGGVVALQSVSFELARGELLALIGPNGAGKSTCFNVLNGQLRPDGGRIHLEARELTGLKPRAIWRLGVGRTFQITATFGSMSVVENVQMALLSHHRRHYSLWARAGRYYREEALEALAQVGAADLAGQSCGQLAYGDLKKVELAVALAHGPRLLLLDEPTAGMAPRERLELMELVARIVAERDCGALFTEHDMDVVFAHAGRILVLDRGELVAAGLPEEVRANREVQRIYLGGEAP